MWPGVLAGSLLLSVAIAADPVAGAGVAAGIAAGATLQALAGAWLVERFLPAERLERARPRIDDVLLLEIADLAQEDLRVERIQPGRLRVDSQERHRCEFRQDPLELRCGRQIHVVPSIAFPSARRAELATCRNRRAEFLRGLCTVGSVM